MPREIEPDTSSAGMQSPEPITEGSLTPELRDVSDAMSAESICSKCGGSKTNRDGGTKSSRFTCRCRPKPDDTQKHEENIPLRACPETDAAVQEIEQLEGSEVGEHSLALSSDSSELKDNSKKQSPPPRTIEREAATTGCVQEINNWIENRIPECDWCKFLMIFLIFVIICVIIGVILGISDLSRGNTEVAMIRRTNFTADEI